MPKMQKKNNMHSQNLNTNWREDKVGNLLLKSKRQKKVKRSEYLDRGLYPIIDQGDDLVGGYTDDESYLFDGDLPMTIFGDHTRRFKYINFPFAVGADGTQLLAPKKEIERRFFYYAIKNAPLKNYGYQRHFKYLKDTKISFPTERKTQENIAGILGTYDDLIENNTKRIKILEEIAQAIYREWFVYFRFPGHEKVKMIDSKTEFGKIPEGWEIGKIKDVVDLLSGYAFKSGTFVEGGKYKIITIKSVHDGQFKPEGSDTIETVPEKMPEHCHLKDGDILLSLTGNIGRACLVYGKDLLLNQRVAKLDYKKSNQPFIYGLFRNSDFQAQLQNLAIGAAQQNLSPVQTAELSIVIPAAKILGSYREAAESMLKEIVELNRQNYVLRQARDLLLPKLVTGEIEVKI